MPDEERFSGLVLPPPITTAHLIVHNRLRKVRDQLAGYNGAGIVFDQCLRYLASKPLGYEVPCEREHGFAVLVIVGIASAWFRQQSPA